VADLYTKKGRPLTVSGVDIFDTSGMQVGRRRGAMIFGPDGRYAGTIVGDTVVYRWAYRGYRGMPFVQQQRAASSEANRLGSTISGGEPFGY
jgi:hypothetical protein